MFSRIIGATTRSLGEQRQRELFVLLRSRCRTNESAVTGRHDVGFTALLQHPLRQPMLSPTERQALFCAAPNFLKCLRTCDKTDIEFCLWKETNQRVLIGFPEAGSVAALATNLVQSHADLQ